MWSIRFSSILQSFQIEKMGERERERVRERWRESERMCVRCPQNWLRLHVLRYCRSIKERARPACTVPLGISVALNFSIEENRRE